MEDLAVYEVAENYGQIDVGVNLGKRAQFRAGWRYGAFKARVDVGVPGLPESDWVKDVAFQSRFVYDTRDSIALPRKGTFLNVRYVSSDRWADGELEYDIVEGVWTRAFEINGNSATLTLGAAETLNGDVPISQQIQLGGIRTFPGLRVGEHRGEGYRYASAGYSWRLAELQPVFGQAVYAGLRIQTGQMVDSFDPAAEFTVLGISGSLTGRTPIGAFVLSLGFVRDSGALLQMTLGRPMEEGSILDETR